MQVIVTLDKEDIVTSPLGCNVAIMPGSGPTIVFTPEAAAEFADDVEALLIRSPGCVPRLREDLDKFGADHAQG